MTTIKELCGYEFEIPDYQRSYRWTRQEVIALLNDLDEFRSALKGNEKYCLQPLVVQRVESINRFKVVDGQQRLTTIFLINQVMQKLNEKSSEFYKMFYSEKRKKTEEVLKSFNERIPSDEDLTIDIFHMYQAYKTIQEWVKQRANENENQQEVIANIMNVILENTFFIWHEIEEDQDAEDIYTKINNGKIQLTNAELIKSLLLKGDFTKNPDAKQTRISLEWDRIEQDLQDDSFWFFLHNDEKYEPRIGLLFDLLAESYYEEYFKESNSINKSDDRMAFWVIDKMIKKKEEEKSDEDISVEELIWKDLLKIYSKLKSWYLVPKKYHIIGYLLTTSMANIHQIFQITKDKTKIKTIKSLIGVIKDKLHLKDEQAIEHIVDLDYTNAADKTKMKKILLLFNIIHYVNKYKENQNTDPSKKSSIDKNKVIGVFDQKFSFSSFKKGRWDLEHIHAKANTSDNIDNQLQNITLLNSSINRSYQDAPFYKKRETILMKDQEGEFIPICTKNVFNKAYTKAKVTMDKWGKGDKTDYINAIKSDLKEFLFGGADDNTK